MRRALVYSLLLGFGMCAAARAAVVLTPLDPVMVDETLHSADGATPVVIEFINRSSAPVDIYWISYSGTRRLECSGLMVGGTWREHTFVSHPFLVVAYNSGGTTERGSGRRIAGFEVAASGGVTDPGAVNTAIISDGRQSPSNPVIVVPRSTPRSVLNSRDNQNYVWIPPGRFDMGCSPDDGDCQPAEKPPHSEDISPGFWLGETEVTQAAYEHVIGRNPSAQNGARLPVESLTWNEAADFCGAIKGRLPSQEEWEYAARAGTQSPRYGSLEAIAWYAGNSGRENHPVGGKPPNAFGLYDMLGNTWEWTAAFDTATGAVVTSGGSRSSEAGTVRASSRMMVEPLTKSDDLGFRCALPATALQRSPDVAQTPPLGPCDPDRMSAGLPYRVYRHVGAVSAPLIVRQIQPEYSEKGRKARLSGTVLLCIVIDDNGKVARAVVTRGLGMGLDEKAIEAVYRWKFQPSSKDGTPVATVANVEVNFRLQ